MPHDFGFLDELVADSAGPGDEEWVIVEVGTTRFSEDELIVDIELVVAYSAGADSAVTFRRVEGSHNFTRSEFIEQFVEPLFFDVADWPPSVGWSGRLSP
jgi:hypothetical protein